jgi:hypothetical protein
MMLGKLIFLIQQLQDGGDRHSHQAADRESTQQREIMSTVDLHGIRIPDIRWFSHGVPAIKNIPFLFYNRLVFPDWIYV